MFKLAIFSVLVASVFAALPPFRQPFKAIRPSQPLPTPPPYRPQPTYSPQPSGRIIAILRSDSDAAPDGSSYQYAFQTENGISAEQSGSLVGSGPDAALGASGSYQFTSPEGVPVRITYVADLNGYQPQGDSIPTPPPIPQAILRAIAYNEAHPEPSTLSSQGRQTFLGR